MTDKEFKRLNRAQLIDIIYQLQLKEKELTADNEKLTEALEDKRLRLDKAGNIAEAALAIHDVLQSAQDAANHYMEEIQIRLSEEREQVLASATREAEAIITQAKQEAANIIAQAKGN